MGDLPALPTAHVRPHFVLPALPFLRQATEDTALTPKGESLRAEGVEMKQFRHAPSLPPTPKGECPRTDGLCSLERVDELENSDAIVQSLEVSESDANEVAVPVEQIEGLGFECGALGFSEWS